MAGPVCTARCLPGGPAASRAGGFLVAGALLLFALLAAAPAAEAAFPGTNGKLAFDGSGAGANSDVFASSADGTGAVPLTGDPAHDYEPAWSADGTQIAFTSLRDGNSEIYVMNADGSGQTRLTSDPADDYRPAWSPDGARIAFSSVRDGNEEIYAMNADGSAPTRLTTDGARDREPAWSPDGSRIAWTSERDGLPEIYVMSADGTGQQRVTVAPHDAVCGAEAWADRNESPDWSPDGMRIAFLLSGLSDGDYCHEVATIKPDGTGFTTVLFSFDWLAYPAWSPDGAWIAFVHDALFGFDPHVDAIAPSGASHAHLPAQMLIGYGPDWQPIPHGYVRPKGATPTSVSLVPSFEACTTPDMTHGPALVAPSCSGPTQTSPHLVVGQPASEGGLGGLSQAQGRLRLDVLAGNPATPADEADVALFAGLTDVRCRTPVTTTCGAVNTPGPPDYAGELEARIVLRMTDRDNNPYPGGLGAGTATDLPLSFPVPCTATGTTIGAGCALSTTLDAVLGETAKESRRAVWELGQVRVRDGGADGDADTTADNSVFAVQGVFVP